MNKTRQWALLTAVACLAIIAAGWFIVVKPQRAHAAQLRTQAKSMQSSNGELQSQVNQLKQQQKDLPAQQKQLSQIATQIPDNPALPSLIRQLSAAADGAGVNLVSLAPSTPTVAAATPAAPATTTTTKTATAPAAPLATIPISVQVQGTYFNVVQFFAAVENLSRAMIVTGFTLSPQATGAASTGSGASTTPDGMNAQITASVFESPQVASAPAQPSTTTTVH
jgi:Tfp pilus assembly protein PilO